MVSVISNLKFIEISGPTDEGGPGGPCPSHFLKYSRLVLLHAYELSKDKVQKSSSQTGCMLSIG